jgi:hypothetical protein
MSFCLKQNGARKEEQNCTGNIKYGVVSRAYGSRCQVLITTVVRAEFFGGKGSERGP